MGMSYSETRDIPIRYRIWFINRIVKEMTKANGSGDGSESESTQRSMSRNNLPPNVRRFT